MTIKCDYCGLVKAVPCRTPPEAAKCKPGDDAIVKVHFALSPADFDTGRARQAVQAIVRNLGPNTVVVDPSHPDHSGDAAKLRKVAAECDVVVVMAMPGDFLDHVTWRAAQVALVAGKRVYELGRDVDRCTAVERIDPARCLTSLETDRSRRMLLAQRKGE